MEKENIFALKKRKIINQINRNPYSNIQDRREITLYLPENLEEISKRFVQLTFLNNNFFDYYENVDISILEQLDKNLIDLNILYKKFLYRYYTEKESKDSNNSNIFNNNIKMIKDEDFH